MDEKVNQFWMKKHLALFGLSRKEKSVSKEVYDLLINKGYQIYPINPNTDQIGTIKCYRSLDEVKKNIEGAIVITNPKISAEVVKQCRGKGINDFWFQYNTMDDNLKSYCVENGINYINSCALIHHKESGFPHSLHRFFYRLFH